jgi:hypothetical protein|tara:strand:+ start:30 stop:308 length:279 start_codon:yes stop_codon:yes gene_type:complete
MSNQWNKEKAPFDEAKLSIIPLVLEATDGRFFIKKANNDCGATMDVYAETDDTEVSPWSTRLPSSHMGWRVIMYRCPTGWIGAFLDVKKKDE